MSQHISSFLNRNLVKAEEKCDTPGGIARAEDPLWKVVFFPKLAEAVPPERECFSGALD